MNVISGEDALNQTSEDGAPNSEASKKLQLKCNPSCLPPAPYTQPIIKKLSEMTKAEVIEIKDFYREQKTKRRSMWLKAKRRDRKA